MNVTTPRLRAHLLAELRDLPDRTATTDQLAGQVPAPWAHNIGRPAPGNYVYPHLLAMEKKGLVRKVKTPDRRDVSWQLVNT